MGGLHSGRPRSHVCIDDCLEIDLMHLNRQKRLRQSDIFIMQWQRWRETNFRKRTIQEHQASVWLNLEKQTLTLKYQANNPENGREYRHKYTLTLESTPCNYGGHRWWFRAPCCGRRVRVLYINLRADLESCQPQCRDCQDLHYASQMASYIERHVSYEKYLLSNYGYTWASIEYHCLKHRYFDITPEYVHKKQMSELTRHLELLRHLIRAERIILKSRIRVLRKLSLEGRREWFEYLANDPERVQDYQEYKQLEASLIASGIIPAADMNTETPPDLEEQPTTETTQEENAIIDLHLARWQEEKDEAEQELKKLEARAA